MRSLSSLRQQLSSIAARKARREELLEQVRSGKYDHIFPASEYYADPPTSPREEPLPGDPLAGFVELEGGVLHRRVELELPGAGSPAAGGVGALPARPYDPAQWNPIAPELLAELLPLADGPPTDPVGLEDVCFLDTETTGLAGGTGTVAFLVGLGWWERRAPAGWRFVVELLLMRDFPHEPGMIRALEERLGRFRVFCTYNGRVFDVPLLRTRAIMNRCRPKLFARPNLDLLFFCRRFWRGVLPSVSLKSVEEGVLGLDRGPDIDGAMIPRIFFDLSRGMQPPLLGSVISHNVQDIATLAGLLDKALCLARDPFGGGELTRWEEFDALARHCERRRDPAGACRALATALDVAPCRGEEKALLLRQAAAHKRLRDWSAAVPIWEPLATDRDPAVAFEAVTELAKYHEHTTRNCAAALAVVEGLLRRLELRRDLDWYIGSGGGADPERLAALEHRRERLRLRLAKARRQAPAP